MPAAHRKEAASSLSCPSTRWTLPASAAPRASVLIVEDDRAARRAITRLLRTQGFAVCEAGTLADAMNCLSPTPPDWILLDLMLPDGCGIELLGRLRADQMTCKTCVITGCASPMLNDARRAGAQFVFTKPLDVDRLMAVLGV